MGDIVGWLLGIATFICWIVAIVQDASSSAIGWLLVDIFVVPVGVVRGFLMLIGAV